MGWREKADSNVQKTGKKTSKGKNNEITRVKVFKKDLGEGRMIMVQGHADALVALDIIPRYLNPTGTEWREGSKGRWWEVEAVSAASWTRVDDHGLNRVSFI